MKKHSNRSAIFLAAILALLPTSLWAGTMGTPMMMPVKDWTWVGSLVAGPVWARGDETQTFYLAPETEKTYFSSKTSSALIWGEVFLGAQKGLTPKWLGQIGLVLSTTGDASFKGFIWDDADVTFNNYSYDYKVRHSAIAVKGRLLLDKNEWVLPWVSASIGAGFNRTDKFVNTPLIFEAIRNNNFTHHVTNTFTYTLGLGAQAIVNEHWQWGAGYEFADWGKSELGRAIGQTLNSGLKINHIYTNGILFNLTYLA